MGEGHKLFRELKRFASGDDADRRVMTLPHIIPFPPPYISLPHIISLTIWGGLSYGEAYLWGRPIGL